MKRFFLLMLIVGFTSFVTIDLAYGAPPSRSKFYDFSEQLIDGEIKKPTALFVDSREKVRFDRLLRLKKSFLPKLFQTAKEKVFK